MAKPDFLPLLPPYLDPGSRGSGVLFMQCLLNTLGYETPVHGLHDGRSVEAVKELQGDLGFEGDDVDGGFGPATRTQLAERFSISVDLVPAHVDHVTHWCGPEHEGELRYAGS